MSYDYGLFIGGEERPAQSGAVIDVRSPATGEAIGHVAEAGQEDVAAAVAAAGRGRGTPPGPPRRMSPRRWPRRRRPPTGGPPPRRPAAPGTCMTWPS